MSGVFKSSFAVQIRFRDETPKRYESAILLKNWRFQIGRAIDVSHVQT